MAMYDDVVARLRQLGYTLPEDGSPDTAISYSIECAAEKIRANINRTEIPDGLHCTWVDMAAGLFLWDKKAAGRLSEGGMSLDLSAPAKRITEGDVSVEFMGASDGSQSPEARLDKLIDSIINPPAYLFARFRRLVW